MFKKIFGKKEEINTNKDILVAALLIHAAKIDENYTEKEKEIIKKALIDLNNINSLEADVLLTQAEKKEDESNQIVEFTRRNQKTFYGIKIKNN